VGQGTFVAARSAGRPGSLRDAGAAASSARRFAWQGLVSQRARATRLPRAASPPRGEPLRFDFMGGRVDPSQLPVTELRRAWSSAVATRISELANPGDLRGWLPLREEIALMLVGRGIECEPEDVLITSGAQQALTLLAHVLVDPGDSVALEQPGYFGAQEAFRACGALSLGIAVDEQGLRTDELARVLQQRRVKLIYTTPSAQCPTGAVLSAARREALLELSDRHQVPIVEDDYDSELRYAGPALPALKRDDPAGRVVYVGTFSKALFPGLRVGYLVAARPLIRQLMLARWASDFASDALAQVAVADLLASGALDRHVRRARRSYARRLAAMLDALDSHMPAACSWTRPEGGHHVWLRLPRGVDPDVVAAAASGEGLAYARGESFSCEGDRFRDHLALAFANEPPERIDEGVRRLGQVIARSSA
jgi:DNA-binding transcriptional MocR family regulator